MSKSKDTNDIKKEETKEAKFSLEVLAKACRKVFGVSESTFAGATYSCTESEYSISEMKEIINTWLKKEVK